MRHHSLWMLLVVAALTALSVSMAAAAEYSVYQWWTNNSDPASGIDRGDTNNFWLDFSSLQSNGHYQNGLWFNGDGYACLQVEWAGNAPYNHFGWFGGYINGTTYTPINTNNGGNRKATISTWDLDGDNSSDGTYGLYEIFSGTESGEWYSPTGDLDWDWTNPPDYWGFYLWANESTYFYSRNTLNQAGSGNEATGRHQLQVFDDPAGGTSDSALEEQEEGRQWVLCWEDLPATDHTVFDYGGSPGTNHIGDKAHPTEPDYQDMIVTFKRIHAYEDPNLNVPEPGTWVLLLASGAIGGWIRRRRKD